MTRWAVKVKRYGGGESVVGLFEDEEEAHEQAKASNADYQTDAYYVEEWKGLS